MVHCDSDGAVHFFCKACARTTAENEIGNSKYKLTCMSTDSCEATFSYMERAKFLDPKTIMALDRNEQEAMLRNAGIDGLARLVDRISFPWPDLIRYPQHVCHSNTNKPILWLEHPYT